MAISSPLAQGRGLKLVLPLPVIGTSGSPLAQGRGLKQSLRNDKNEKARVAPRAGAWIETGT